MVPGLRLTFSLFALLIVLLPGRAVALPQEGGGGGGGGGGHPGDLFGDLVHIKRHPTTGQPILQKRLVELPEDQTGYDYCPIAVDAAGLEVPFAPLSCDVDPAVSGRIEDE